jgi:hypothetical protein
MSCYFKDLKQNQLQFFPAWKPIKTHITKVSMMRFYFLSVEKDKPNVITHMPANAPSRRLMYSPKCEWVKMRNHV